MRLPLVVLGLVAVVVAGCGEDDPGAAGKDRQPSTTSVAAEPARLECPGGIRTFVVAGAPVGSTLPTYRSAEVAAQAEVDDDDEAESYVEVGDDGVGVRYAFLDASGAVVSEAVFKDAGGEWKVASKDTCA